MKFDIAIIGGGPAGYTAAERAGANGLRTVLFEKKAMGGVCLNEGCTPWKVAACIVRARTAQPILTTADLVAAVAPCTPKKDESKFLTKLFQALRIEVNGEMEALKMALEQSLKVLRPGGRLVVISYHSLEDRLVKNFLRSGNFEGRIEKDFFGKPETPFEIITRKAVTPSSEELVRNPRSRSAKLRAAAKIVRQ